MNKRRLLIIICINLLLLVGIHAQEEDKSYRWNVELAGALNNYSGWEVEPSITYRPIPYAGITMGLLFGSVIDADGFTGDSRDGRLYWNTVDDNITGFYFAFRPSILLSTPAVVFGRDKDMALSFQLSPGLTVTPPNNRFDIEYFPSAPGVYTHPLKTERVKNKGGRCVYYHIKSAIVLQLDDRYILSAGYTLSDFDVYGGSRNIVIEGKKLDLEKHRFMHSGFISLGYCF